MSELWCERRHSSPSAAVRRSACGIQVGGDRHAGWLHVQGVIAPGSICQYTHLLSLSLSLFLSLPARQHHAATSTGGASSTDRHAGPVIVRLFDVGRKFGNHRGRHGHLVAWPLIGRLGRPEHEQLVSVLDALKIGKHRRRGWGGVCRGDANAATRQTRRSRAEQKARRGSGSSTSSARPGG